MRKKREIISSEFAIQFGATGIMEMFFKIFIFLFFRQYDFLHFCIFLYIYCLVIFFTCSTVYILYVCCIIWLIFSNLLTCSKRHPFKRDNNPKFNPKQKRTRTKSSESLTNNFLFIFWLLFRIFGAEVRWKVIFKQFSDSSIAHRCTQPGWGISLKY